MLVRVGRAVRLAERVTARDQRDRLLVVHRHPRERLADITSRGGRVGIAVGPLRVDVDEPHLHRAERRFELAITRVTLVAEPLGLRAPVDVLIRLPDVLATTGETERLKAHRLQGDVAGQHHQVRPRQVLAVLLLDRPQQPAGLVEVRVVRPAIQRREALLTGPRAATAVADAIRPGAVPRHPDHERAVVTVIGRPPVLRRRQDVRDVPLDLAEVQGFECRGVVEFLAQRIGHGRVLGKDFQVQPVRPPPPVPPALRRVRGAIVRNRTAADGGLVVHLSNNCVRTSGHWDLPESGVESGTATSDHLRSGRPIGYPGPPVAVDAAAVKR